tara:strand:+ start:10281 stop:10742 length:462 start_codon:yes stop_codon:yes gene_type:complete
MSNSPIIRIEDAIKTTIAANYNAGFSGVNMQSRVVVGELTDPPIVPYATVTFVDFIEQHGQTLGRYQGDAEFTIVCYIGGSSTELDSRRKQAINLASDMIREITNNRQLGFTDGTVDDVRCSFLARDGDKYGIPNVGIAYIRLLVTRQTDRGD